MPISLGRRKTGYGSPRFRPELADLIQKGERLDPTYEGGGFGRLEGIFYSNLPDTNILGGPSRDWSRAFSGYNRSMQSDVAYDDPKTPSWMDEQTETGAYFYQTHFYYAHSLANHGDSAKACRLIKMALKKIDDGEIAKGRQAETSLAHQRLKILSDDLRCP